MTMEHERRTAAQAHEACRWRQGFNCGRCWTGLREHEGQLHHRVRRRNLDKDALWCTCVLVLLCAPCHTWVHAHPEASRAAGLIVSELTLGDVRDVPLDVRYPWTAPSLNLCDGTVVSAPAVP